MNLASFKDEKASKEHNSQSWRLMAERLGSSSQMTIMVFIASQIATMAFGYEY
jgi:hypothetical protein